MQFTISLLFFFITIINPIFSGKLGSQFELISYPNPNHSNFSLNKLSLEIGYAVAYQNPSSDYLVIDIFYPNGTLRYPEIDLNHQLAAYNPNLCYIDGYGFVVTYMTLNTISGIVYLTGQVFNLSGVNLTKPFVITNSTNINSTSQIAQLNTFDGFIVGFTQNTSNNNSDVFYQIFDRSGNSTSQVLKANTLETMGDISFTTLNSPLGFAIAYSGIDNNIYYVIIDNKGDILKDETKINAVPDCGLPVVQGMTNQFAIVYMCQGNGWTDFYGQYINLQDFSGPEFQINKFPMPKMTLASLSYSIEQDILVIIYANGAFVYSQLYNSIGDNIQTYTEITDMTTFSNPVVTLTNAGYIVLYSDQYNQNVYGQMMTFCPQELFWNISCLSNFPQPPASPYSYNICPLSNGSFQFDYCCTGVECHTCEAEVCTDCQNAYTLNSTGNQCIQCPEGALSCAINITGDVIATECNISYYLIDSMCLPCQSDCDICVPSDNDPYVPLCIACHQDFLQFNNTCVSTCPNGTVKNYLLCCPADCTLCNNGSYVCTDCNYGFSLYEGGCVSECPPGFANNQSNSICESCPSPASTCIINSTTDQFVIESCSNGLLLFENQCISDCPNNFFNESSYCCPEFCVKCYNGSPACEKCEPGYFVFEGSCVSECPELTIPNDVGVCLSIEAMCELVCDVSYLCDVGFFSDQCKFVRPIIDIVAILSVITGILKLYLLLKSKEQSILIKFLRNHAYSDMMVALTIFIVFDPSLLQGDNLLTIIVFYGNLLSCFFTVEIFFYGYLKMSGNDFFDRYNQTILILTYIGAIILGFLDVVGMTAIYQSPYIIIGIGGVIITTIDIVIVFRMKKMNRNIDIKNLIVYPSILAITWWLSSISFLGVSLNEGYFWVAFCASIMNYAQPMLNALLYGRRILTSYHRFKKVKAASLLTSQALFTANSNLNRESSELSLNSSANQLQDFSINKN